MIVSQGCEHYQNFPLQISNVFNVFVIVLFSQQGQAEKIKPLGCVVSLGTGRIPVTEVKNVDVFRPEGILDAYRAVSGALSLSRMLIDQVKCFIMLMMHNFSWYLSVCLCDDLYVCVSICIYLYIYLHLSYLSYLSIYQSVYLSVYLYLSVCLF